MSSPFSSTAAAALSGAVVRRDVLVFFNFLTTPYRLRQGFGNLRTNDGHDWSGLGEFGQISDIESSIAGSAPQVTFALSGVDAGLISKSLDSSNEVKGRSVTVYFQFFDENFQLLDNPYAVWVGIMDVMRVKQNASTCSIELTAETIFTNRSHPPLGTLSDRDQQRLRPGDTGLSLMPEMVSKSVTWPYIAPQP